MISESSNISKPWPPAASRITSPGVQDPALDVLAVLAVEVHAQLAGLDDQDLARERDCAGTEL